MATADGLAHAPKRFRRHIVKLLATTIVRGSRRGESHGGLYLIDLERQLVEQPLDWNTEAIEWQGDGWDRGLRGLAVDGDRIYVAASDRLIALTPRFEFIEAWQSPYLKHCHEISTWDRTLYLTSTACDSILGFDLDKRQFHWAMHVQSSNFRFAGSGFNPLSDKGPLAMNKLHINNVHCNEHGMYLSGLRTGGLLHFNGRTINMAVQLPQGSMNARPFRDGVVFNDTNAGVLRYTGRGEGSEDRAMPVPAIDADRLEHTEFLDEGIVRSGFARGLCVLSETIVAGGSSPATITMYNLAANETLGSVTVSMDARAAVHSIARWPYN